MKEIDLRSDTVTRPSLAMREVMAMAEVGDDVYGEDPTVNHLETLVADMLGKEAAIFVPTGTQSNLIAIMSHCERGDEYIVGQQAHTYQYEGGGAAVLGSIQPQPIDFESDGTLDLNKVADAIKPDDFHFARTRLLCLENTQDGKVLPLDYLQQAYDLAQMHGLGLHLDGARLFNAVVALDVEIRQITDWFDTVSICLSKGLGAPVGSVLCGTRSQIAKARRWRKVLGGGMRQAGILAAAGIYALQHNVHRLKEDHENAKLLADLLSTINGIDVDYTTVQTNMVFANIDPQYAMPLSHFLKQRNIKISTGKSIRFVTHLDVSAQDIEAFAEAVRQFFATVNL